MAHTAPLLGTHASENEFDSATRLSKKLGSVWNRLWGHTLKRSPGINRKSRVLYSGPGFLFSAAWPSMPKKHSKGLIINREIATSNSSKVAPILKASICCLFVIPVSMEVSYCSHAVSDVF